jgi:hypothetical protein
MIISIIIHGEIMKKISKEEWKEILEDESYSKNKYVSEKKSWKIRNLERTINFLRFELLYPKMEREYDITGSYEQFPKGAGSAVIVNSIAGAFIYGKNNIAEGAIIGGASTFIQLVLGFGIRYGAEYISKKYNKFKNKI